MSVIVVATVHPVPEHRAAAIAAFEDTIASVHAEDEGCQVYALHEDDDHLVMIEKQVTQEALTVVARRRPRPVPRQSGPTGVQGDPPLAYLVRAYCPV